MRSGPIKILDVSGGDKNVAAGGGGTHEMIRR
jgi:hypothetical protein